MKLVENRILVLPFEEKNDSLFEVPKDIKERPVIGKIIQVGPGININGTWVAVDAVIGDIIIYGQYAGNEIDIDGVEYVVLRNPDILAILESDEIPKQNKKEIK